MIKDTNNLPKIIDNLNSFNHTVIYAGVKSGGKIGMIAHVQEYGATITAKQVGGYLMVPMPDGSFRKLKQVTIPARPFIQMSVIEHSNQWKDKAADALQAIIHGESAGSYKQGIAKLMVQNIKQTMRTGGFAANAPLTVARKGSSTPLLDKGTLIGSIDSEVH